MRVSVSLSTTGSGIGLGGLLFVIFLIMKLTESSWGDHFPRFLQSTDAWWDGWFMVFLPLWAPFAISIIIISTIALLFFLKH